MPAQKLRTVELSTRAPLRGRELPTAEPLLSLGWMAMGLTCLPLATCVCFSSPASFHDLGHDTAVRLPDVSFWTLPSPPLIHSHTLSRSGRLPPLRLSYDSHLHSACYNTHISAHTERLRLRGGPMHVLLNSLALGSPLSSPPV